MNIIKKRLMSFTFENIPRISLSCMLVPVQYRKLIRIWPVEPRYPDLNYLELTLNSNHFPLDMLFSHLLLAVSISRHLERFMLHTSRFPQDFEIADSNE